jgi:hypothetical protein
MCQRFDVTGNLKNFANFFGTKQGLGIDLFGFFLCAVTAQVLLVVLTVDGSWAHMAEEKGEGHADCLPPKSGRLIF